MDEKRLKDSVYTTYKVFNERGKSGLVQATGALRMYMKYYDPNYFTSTNAARQDIVEYIAREELAVYLARSLLKTASSQRPRNAAEAKLFDSIHEKKLDGVSDRKIISELAYCMLGKEENSFGQSSDGIAEIACDLFATGVAHEKDKRAEEIQQEAQRNIDPRHGVKNLRVNPTVVNQCAREVLDGTQITIQNGIRRQKDAKYRPARNYNLNDEMFATTDIGNRRSNQEDSVLIMYHPKNQKYKMLLVADGMGGHSSGEKASSEIAKKMYHWFSQLDPRLLRDENYQQLQAAWTNELQKVSDEIRQKYVDAGSTFVGAIVGEKSTMIASIGDSRAYILGTDNELYQLTDDDNLHYRDWQRRWDIPSSKLTPQRLKMKEIEKDLLRFRKDSNIITNSIGAGERIVTPKYTLIRNDCYSTLMLFSDGVTDCLSDSQIKAITRKTDYRKLSQMLAIEAIQKDSYIPRDYYGFEEYNPVIKGGKDNTTVAVLRNKQGNGGKDEKDR